MKKYNRLIKLLNECAAACEHCVASCLNEEHAGHLTTCIKTGIVCASVCRTTALSLEHGFSDQASLLLCEEICRACADECNKHEHEHCKACAEICNNCAEQCRQAPSY